MKLTRLLLAGLAPAFLAGLGSAQSFTLVPDSWACTDVSSDGEIVVGYGIDPATGSQAAFSWRWKTDPAPVFLGGRVARAVSDDGTVIVGDMEDPVGGYEQAGRWTAATGWVALESYGSACPAPAHVYDMTPDGSTMVGFVYEAGSCTPHACFWTEADGLVILGAVSGLQVQARASAISADGSQAVGFNLSTANNYRSPTYWTLADKVGVNPDPNDQGEYYGVNADGTIRFGELSGKAFYEKDGVKTLLPLMDPQGSNWAAAMSEDGARVFGTEFVSTGFWPPVTTYTAWVWSAQSGMVGLQDRLTQLGVAGVPELRFVEAVTPDARVVVGASAGQGWIAELPPAPKTQPYGCGSQNPLGSLVQVSGSAAIGGVLTLGVDDPTATMAGPAMAFVNFSLDPDPNYPCGTPLFGYGMTGPVGELLISVATPNPIVRLTSPDLWTTALQTVDVDFYTPLDPDLYGVELYAQGALFTLATFEIGLTNGLRIQIGND